MRLELVHTEGRRFNRVRRDTKQERERDESSEDDSESRPVRTHQPIALSCIAFAPIPPDSDSEDEHLWPVPMPEMDEVLDPETGMMVNLLNEENIQDDNTDNDQCFLDPQTGLLSYPSSNVGGNSKKVCVLNPSNKCINEKENKALEVSRSNVSYEHISAQEKVKHTDHENSIPYQPFPFSGKLNNVCADIVMILL
jgi:hypothetical protein